MKKKKQKTEKNILIAFLLNLGFAIFEFIGGFLTNSVAIISDSIHDMGDALSIGVSYFLEKKSKRNPNMKYTCGYVRYSILGALITTVLLFIGSALVIYNGVVRLFNPVDVNVDLYGYYCEVVILREDNGETLTTGSVVRLGIDPITPEISLEEKVEYFTGSEINIDDVLISNIVEADEFDVEYLYYLDEECTVLTNKANSGANVDGGAPVNVGSYYVKVTVSGNSNYNEVSSVSKVTILEVVVPPVEEEEDEKNPVTLDNIILVVVALVLGIVLAIRCLPFVFKY